MIRRNGNKNYNRIKYINGNIKLKGNDNIIAYNENMNS
jgi:hypothetical protein